MSGIINKMPSQVKDAITGEHHTTSTTTGTTTGTTAGTHTAGTAEQLNVGKGVAGPHNSRVANAADPRVDSDLDGSRHVGTHGTTGTTGTYGTAGTTGTTGTHATTGSSGLTGGLTGAHHSPGTGTTGTGYTGTSGSTGYGSGAGLTSTTGSGPLHSNNFANKLDPRVDSDFDGSRNAGLTQIHGNTAGTAGVHGSGVHSSHTTTTGTYPTTGSTGGISSSTNAGPHNSSLANKADPRVDSDLDGRGNRHGASTGGFLGSSGSHATPGSGTAQNTAGPHNSDTANKLDPRVDSDLDGSKTVGGNKTHA
ncbi:MAG: hypothetical protein M1818_002677 [Claussenomyces sp. TS43310]|nr:MAG: hypothetical protein M1818_002677 [Claussenomyces sp. TS43310]